VYVGSFGVWGFEPRGQPTASRVPLIVQELMDLLPHVLVRRKASFSTKLQEIYKDGDRPVSLTTAWAPKGSKVGGYTHNYE
jgi:hypothetical protein